MSAPTVSVVIPAFDQSEMLAEALASVAAQEFTDFEVLVVDDGSAIDLGPACASAPLGDRIRVLRQENAGGAAARNHGIAEARGEWIAFLDHDDVWLPTRLGQLDEAPATAALVFCQCIEFGPQSEGRTTPQRARGPITLADLLQQTLIRTLSTVLIRRDAFPGSTWFDSRYHYANDIDLYYRLAQQNEIGFLDEVLVRKRIHADQATRNHVASHDEMVAILEALEAPELHRLARRRWAHHKARAAKAARRDGDREGAKRRYRELLARCPAELRAWRGYLGSLLG